MSMKNPNYPIGNRTRDLPACSAVPQSNTPPRTAHYFTKRRPPFTRVQGVAI
jgi:hypothetical protein